MPDRGSSLERLNEAPFDELKIDMMFVRGAEHDPALRMIADSAVTLHSLGPDGFIYVLTEEQDGALLVIKPAQ